MSLTHKIAYRKTRRILSRVRTSTAQEIIRDLPLGVWKIPPRHWLLSLRRHDGMRDIRRVSGNIKEAHTARDVYMKTGTYSMAWLIEDDGARR